MPSLFSPTLQLTSRVCLNLMLLWVFRLFLKRPPEKEFWGGGDYWNNRHNCICPDALWLSVLWHSSSQKTTKSRDRDFFSSSSLFSWPLWHLIPFHSGMQPRQNNYLMGVESDYHCSVLSPMSAENIVQQQQLLASLMPGQARSRWWGVGDWGGGGYSHVASSPLWDMCVSYTKDACNEALLVNSHG